MRLFDRDRTIANIEILLSYVFQSRARRGLGGNSRLDIVAHGQRVALGTDEDGQRTLGADDVVLGGVLDEKLQTTRDNAAANYIY